jgi:alpha-D-ribose 1-methylphosphonate 5-triphosphate synthase subunit PhnI
MQDRPTVHELLDAVQRFLDEEIVPNTEGRRQFVARVSANALRMIGRELLLEEEHQAREWAALDTLLGPAQQPAGRAARASALRNRNDELCARIRAGSFDDGPAHAAVVASVRQSVQDKLAVTDPAYGVIRA